MSMSRLFYASDAVSHPVAESHLRTTFDLALQGSPFVRGLMLTQGDEAIGYGLLSFTYSNEAGGLVVWMEELYIALERRGQGWGKQFFAFVHEEYRGCARRFRLEVTAVNTRAIALYRSLGYGDVPYLLMGREEVSP